MMTPPRLTARQRVGCRYWGAAFLVILLAGCASQPGNHGTVAAGGTASAGREGQGAVLNGKLASFLSGTEGHATMAVDESPWGQQVRVTAQPPYYAASGRECRLLDVVSRDTGAEQKAVVCEIGDGWIAHRPVTHVLSNGSESR